MSLRVTVAALLLFAGCASAPTTKPDGSSATPTPAPDRVLEARRQREADQERLDLPRTLLQLDLALESYAKALNSRGVATADQSVERLDRLLRQLVNGDPPMRQVDPKDVIKLYGSHLDSLKKIAADGSDKLNQGVALAALGFADDREVMPIIMQGAQQDDTQLIDRAVFGLAILKDPRTPPGVLIRVLENPKHPEDGRLQAAWALYVLQEAGAAPADILAEWRKILSGTADWHPLITAQAVRGLGLTRKTDDADLVARFLAHPTPKVRLAAAVAIGRMNAQKHWEALLPLIGPGETVPSVRLAARKALQALAGNTDRGYDVAMWRKEFERGNQNPMPAPAPAKGNEPAKQADK